MKRIQLADDGYCFACGENNQYGLRLRFTSEKGKIRSEFIPQKIHQGFKDIVHGGIISTILDEAMMKAVLLQGIEVITAEMTVRFKSTLSVGNNAFIEAEIVKMGNRLIVTTARIKKKSGTIVAEAEAKLIRNA